MRARGRLAELDERRARVVELRFFGGMQLEEIAEVLQVFPAGVSRDWRTAKAFLSAEMRR